MPIGCIEQLGTSYGSAMMLVSGCLGQILVFSKSTLCELSIYTSFSFRFLFPAEISKFEVLVFFNNHIHSVHHSL